MSKIISIFFGHMADINQMGNVSKVLCSYCKRETALGVYQKALDDGLNGVIQKAYKND